MDDFIKQERLTPLLMDAIPGKMAKMLVEGLEIYFYVLLLSSLSLSFSLSAHVVLVDCLYVRWGRAHWPVSMKLETVTPSDKPFQLQMAATIGKLIRQSM